MEWVWLAGGAVVGLAVAVVLRRGMGVGGAFLTSSPFPSLASLVVVVGVGALIVVDVISTDFDLGAAFYGPMGTAVGYGVTKAFGALFD